MVTVSGLSANFPGLVHSRSSRILLGNSAFQGTRNSDCLTKLLSFRMPRRKIVYFCTMNYRVKPLMAIGGNHQELIFDDELPPEPFWMSLVKELIWSLESLVIFLREQPSQLKYIEWPSFQTTLKTATLTLVLVALLIVALTSVDATISFVSRLFIRT